jgi:PAS domain S-box-containing protein
MKKNNIKNSPDNTVEQLEIEKKLRISEEKHRMLFSKANDAIFIIQDNKVVDCNEKSLEMFGCIQQEIMGRPMYHFLPEKQPDGSDSILNFYDLTLLALNGKSQFFYWKFLRFKGEQFDTEVSLNSFVVNGDKMLQAIVRDITRRKEAEEFKNKSITSYFEVFNTSSDFIFIINESEYIIDVNKSALDKYQLSKEEIIGNTLKLLSDKNQNDFILLKEYFSAAWRKEQQKFDWWGKTLKDEVFPMEVILHHGSYFGKNVLIANARDISERIKYENSLRESEERYKTLASSAPVGIFQTDKSGKVVFINKKLKEISGLKNEIQFSKEWTGMIHPEDKGKNEAGKPITRSEVNYKPFEYRIINKNKVTKWIKAQFTWLYSSDEEIAGLVGTIEDITNTKKAAEEKLRAEIAEATTAFLENEIAERKISESKLKETLSEREMLLKEVHHRVKNNLQVISSILNLQGSYVKDPYTLLMLKECRDRIKSMSFIHESLYQTKNFSHVDFGDYLKSLCSNLLYSYSVSGRVTLNYDIDTVLLTLDTAIPTGLIVNELVSNSLKYAFPDNQKGNIFVSLKRKEDGTNVLAVEDDGVGFPATVNYKETDSLGLQLVVTLADQIDGEIILEKGRGTNFVVEFKAN